MKGITIRIKPGFKIDGGEGVSLGKDSTGKQFTFWRSMGRMEIPFELALVLENERPQRFEIIDRKPLEYLIEHGVLNSQGVANKQVENKPEPLPASSSVNELSLDKLNQMTKDEINDWAARRAYDVNTRDKKQNMIDSLVKQIEKRTGYLVV